MRLTALCFGTFAVGQGFIARLRNAFQLPARDFIRVLEKLQVQDRNMIGGNVGSADSADLDVAALLAASSGDHIGRVSGVVEQEFTSVEGYIPIESHQKRSTSSCLSFGSFRASLRPEHDQLTHQRSQSLLHVGSRRDLNMLRI